MVCLFVWPASTELCSAPLFAELSRITATPLLSSWVTSPSIAFLAACSGFERLCGGTVQRKLEGEKDAGSGHLADGDMFNRISHKPVIALSKSIKRV